MTAARHLLVQVYIVARTNRAELARCYAEDLEKMGCRVVGRWFDQQQEGIDPVAEPPRAGRAARTDLDQLAQADLVLFLSEGSGEAGHGGRHVEFGAALAWGKEIILVGQPETIFHQLPEIDRHATREQALAALAQRLQR